MKEQELTKLYYSIGEVAELLHVNASTIRFWEKQFPQIKPKKNKKGNRLFTPAEILLLQKIALLLHKEGYTIEGAKKALKEKKEEDITNIVIDDLNEIKKRLIQILNKV